PRRALEPAARATPSRRAQARKKVACFCAAPWPVFAPPLTGQAVWNLTDETVQRFDITRLRDPETLQLKLPGRDKSLRDFGLGRLVDTTIGPIVEGSGISKAAPRGSVEDV
ncbi:hypothetical protein, partial [Salipiger thiooxidans]|uniref:hypothetical protein n=1 Tax=Salipiger thiooxidans TaxID=282683 RepID=UPI001CFA8EB2